MKAKIVLGVVVAVALVLNLQVSFKGNGPTITSHSAMASMEAQAGECFSCCDEESGQTGVRIACYPGCNTCVTQPCVSGMC